MQRMTTTLTTAMAEGAERVRVFREIQEVESAAAEYEPSARLRGGERHGQQIDGFDGDNSPLHAVGTGPWWQDLAVHHH